MKLVLDVFKCIPDILYSRIKVLFQAKECVNHFFYSRIHVLFQKENILISYTFLSIFHSQNDSSFTTISEITSQLYKQNGNIFQVIPQPCISFVEKVCSVLQTTKSAFRYTCTLESPVPPPNCNITYDELEICAQFSANNLDFYFIKDPGTELCDTISVIDQNVHGKQSL
jgi:hypothetical protein